MGEGQIELQDTLAPPVPEKLASRIPGYPGYQRRNELQTNLQILTELFLEDIASLGENGDDAEALRESYCTNGALSQYSQVSRDLLRTRYSALFEEQVNGPTLAPVRTKKGLSPEFIAEALSRRPILLLGDRGVGKSTFIKHLYKVDASDVFEDALVFYIDFGSKPAIVQDLQSFVANEIERQLIVQYGVDIRERNFIHGVLHGEITRFERGMYADLRDVNPDLYLQRRTDFIEERLRDRDEYLRLSLEHVSSARRKQIVVFLDNVDQRPDEFQEAVFIIGQSIATNWPVTVFISLRPETFYRSRLSGALSAYHARAFTISPPRVDEVLAKRIGYGIKLLERGLSTGSGVVHSDNLRDYLVVLRRSFSSHHDLIEFLDNMCGGNIRLAFDFVKDFISSAHVDTQKILDIYRKSGSYTVPVHEFLRAVTFGEHAHYYPPNSEILNVFDVSSADGKEHFLAGILLAYLERMSQRGEQEGFTNTGAIYSDLQTIGFDPRQIDSCVKRLLSKNLIESATKVRELRAASESSHYRITSVGAYYVKRLVNMFTYCDAMVEDTPILDAERRVNIGEARTLNGRLARVEEFVSYLDDQWPQVGHAQLALDWPATSAAIRADVSRIRNRVGD